MNRFFEWHPMAVHFPLALVVTAAFALSAARLTPLRRHAAALAIVGTWDLCLGAIAALFALATGYSTVIHQELGIAARHAVTLHVTWAIGASVGLLLLAAWRGAGTAQDSRPSRVFLLALWVVTAALIVTGYRGGQNVYRHAIGVAQDTRVSKVPPPGATE
jgi:uncharacterized membrane protein